MYKNRLSPHRCSATCLSHQWYTTFQFINIFSLVPLFDMDILQVDIEISKLKAKQPQFFNVPFTSRDMYKDLKEGNRQVNTRSLLQQRED